MMRFGAVFGRFWHRTTPQFYGHKCGAVWLVLDWYIFQDMMTNYLYSINYHDNMTISFKYIYIYIYIYKTKRVTQIYKR